MVPTLLAATPEEAETVAAPLFGEGRSVVVKILSRDIVHKSDVDGVRLNLADGPAVRKAAAEVIAKAQAAMPDARIAGVTIQPMIVRPKAHELILGIAEDPTFGPVVVFGQGGTGVEVIDDKAVALPPLDLAMAHALIARTRVSRVLAGYRNVPAARVDEVALVLVKLAQLRADMPEMRELDINPLLADATCVLALDARIAIAPRSLASAAAACPRFAVRPYPSEWERHIVIGESWRIFVRPMRPEDEDDRPRFPPARHHGRPAAALLRAGEGFRPRLRGAAHPARLRARHGVRRVRRGRRASCSAACGCMPTPITRPANTRCCCAATSRDAGSAGS